MEVKIMVVNVLVLIKCLSALPHLPVFEESFFKAYRKTSNIRCTLIGDKIVYHSDVVGASPVGIAFLLLLLKFRDLVRLILRDFTVHVMPLTFQDFELLV